MADRTERTPAKRFVWERVIRASDLQPVTRLVAMMLATYADINGGSIRPGQERLSRDCGHDSSRTARRHLAVLRERGYITRIRRGSSFGIQAMTDEYILTLPRGALNALLHPSCEDRCSPDAYPDGGHYVYVIGEVDGDCVKIGHSENPGRRLPGVQTGSTNRLHVLGAEPGTPEIERGVHAALAGFRVSGEWFNCTAEQALEVIRQRPRARPTRQERQAERDAAETEAVRDRLDAWSMSNYGCGLDDEDHSRINDMVAAGESAIQIEAAVRQRIAEFESAWPTSGDTAADSAG